MTAQHLHNAAQATLNITQQPAQHLHKPLHEPSRHADRGTPATPGAEGPDEPARSLCADRAERLGTTAQLHNGAAPRLLPPSPVVLMNPRAVSEGRSLRASRAALALLLLELDGGMVRLLQVLAESARPEPVALSRLEALGLVDDGAVTPLGSELLGAMVVPA